MSAEGLETTSKFQPSTWLRWLGTLTFLGASGGFLVEGWTDAATVRRELAWFVVTLGLTGLGILAARRLRDAAGARIFLGLAAATIPAHFAQAGAETWSYFVEGTSSRLAVAGASALLLVLAPPLCLGVSALVRRRGVVLTSLLFALSCPLLLPSRDGNIASGLAMVELLVLVLLELRAFRHDPALQTIEGIAARALLLVPCGILLVRNAFYSPTHLWIAALFGAPSIVLLTLPRVSIMNKATSQICQATAMAGLFSALSVTGMDLRLLGLALSALALAGTRTTMSSPKIFASIGAAFFALSAVAGAIWPSTAYAVLVVPIGTLHVLSAYQGRSAALFVSNALATFVGLLGHFAALVRLPTHDVWLLPATLGIGLLVLASLAERQRPRLDRLRLRLSSHFRGVPQ